MENSILNVDITPNTKLLASLRSNNLTNNDAVSDLLDNAIDADVNAKNIYITKTKEALTISDDGAGMNRELLIDALKLGSAGRDRPTITDLGLFGMGLKNSVLSLGRRTRIITKSVDDVHLTAIFDLDEILANDAFEIPLYQSEQADIDIFNHATKDAKTGTYIEISKIDRITYATDGSFKNSLIKHLGEVFRVFIKDGLNIYIDELLVNPMDPLVNDYALSSQAQLEDETFTFDAPDGRKFNLRIKLSFLPILLNNVKSNYKHSMANQGFYIMRNDRQIKRATWFGLITQHNSYNRVRGEVYFSGDIDDILGVPYEKNSIKMQDWLFDKLRSVLLGKVNALKVRAEAEQKASRITSEQEIEDFQQIVENIDKKANRISSLNSGLKDVPKPVEPRDKTKVKPTPNGEIESKPKRKLVDIDLAKLGGPYICSFEPLLDGRLKITFNSEHDFYTKLYITQDLTTKDAFTKLLFALGHSIASLSKQTEEYAEMMDDFQRHFGETFRKLID